MVGLLIGPVFLSMPTLSETLISHPMGGVSVAQVDPAGSGWFEDPFDFVEHSAKGFKVLLDRFFQSELALDSVISELPVRWRSDETIDRVGRQTFQN